MSPAGRQPLLYVSKVNSHIWLFTFDTYKNACNMS